MGLLTCCLCWEGGGQEGGQYSCGGHAASGHYVTVSMVCCGLTVVCMLTRARLSHHYSAAAAARRLAGAGLGREEAGEGRTDHWHHRPGSPPPQHHHWCRPELVHTLLWSLVLTLQTPGTMARPRTKTLCFHDVWRWREVLRVIRTPARGGYGLSVLLCCGMTWGGISTGVTKLSTMKTLDR